MIVVDANLLLYAHDRASPFHDAARQWLESIVNSNERVGIPLQSLLAFARIATSPAVLNKPISAAAAIGTVRSWLARPNVVTPGPSERHWEILADVAASGQARGALLMDAHLAALTIEHGATLMTTDRGFARFPKLRFTNPIVS